MSRLPSPSSRGVRPEGPGNDAYVVMLLVAFLALVLGTVLLGMEQYDFYGKIVGIVVDEQTAEGTRIEDYQQWVRRQEEQAAKGGGAAEDQPGPDEGF